MRNDTSRAAQGGVTLMELMIVLVIVAILGSISMTAYRSYMMRSNRSEGKSALLRIQVAEEKYFLQNGTYTAAIAAAPPAGLGQLATSQPNGNYTLAIAAGLSGTIASSYLATATAVGGQVNDTAACLTLSIDDQNNRTPALATGCWK